MDRQTDRQTARKIDRHMHVNSGRCTNTFAMHYRGKTILKNSDQTLATHHYFLYRYLPIRSFWNSSSLVLDCAEE